MASVTQAAVPFGGRLRRSAATVQSRCQTSSNRISFPFSSVSDTMTSLNHSCQSASASVDATLATAVAASGSHSTYPMIVLPRRKSE